MSSPAVDEAALLAELRRLEESLLTNSTRRNRDKVASLLTEDFKEFGSSGRVYGKSDVLDMLAEEQPQDIVGEDFALQVLSEDAALLTYDSVKAGSAKALRSSLWVRREGRWKLKFHQGTRIPWLLSSRHPLFEAS